MSLREATVLSHPTARAVARNIVSVASGKGGVGKTWFSITLAHALARQGGRVLLFDGDLGLANVDIQLGLMPTHDLGDVIAGRCEMAQAITPFAAGRFDVLAGKSGSGALAQLSSNGLRDLREALATVATRYDRVIADLAAGVDAGVQALAGFGGPVLVIANDEPTSLTDAYAFIKLAVQRQPGVDVRIVVNAAESKPAGRKTYEGLRRVCEGFLKISPPLAGVLRRDPKVRDAIRHQAPLLIRHPTAMAAEDVEALARNLAG